jgi:hypothetical protein
LPAILATLRANLDKSPSLEVVQAARDKLPRYTKLVGNCRGCRLSPSVLIGIDAKRGRAAQMRA